jgi:hypothetical protein
MSVVRALAEAARAHYARMATTPGSIEPRTGSKARAEARSRYALRSIA